MKRSEIQKVVSDIACGDLRFSIMKKGDGFLLQVQFMAGDLDSGELEIQKCRKWYISSYACRAEIVRTAHKAARAAASHEIDEKFSYRGHRIYSPHFDPDVMVQMAEKSGESVFNRREPMPE